MACQKVCPNPNPNPSFHPSLEWSVYYRRKCERVRTQVVLKPRKVSLATQTVDVTTHGRPLALRCFRRTTAGMKLDTILEAAEKKPCARCLTTSYVPEVAQYWF